MNDVTIESIEQTENRLYENMPYSPEKLMKRYPVLVPFLLQSAFSTAEEGTGSETARLMMMATLAIEHLETVNPTVAEKKPIKPKTK